MVNQATDTGIYEPSAPQSASRGQLALRLAKVASLEKCRVPDCEPNALFEQACRSAVEAGGQLLFEVPAALFGHDNERAVALQYGPYRQELFFMVLGTSAPHIRIVAGQEAPSNVFDFAIAYADVLQMIANDRAVNAQMTH